ncbi:deaminase [Sphaerisporangium melleum]|uniref:Deaminase n=1 Tax=Sphaerisporangium melleum TaxID=321316 RepID=A0A917VF97_9ACTN|nr:dihydrofolate reductase family protein [Sphaerisporangium melleum]GGK73988.1 deaminase [Sphaerisporangium melleum]GII70860.1 deaminase [Sphaerisporangium melleum]
MRKIIHYVHTSLDGCIAGPNGEFDWPVLGPEWSDYSLDLARRAGAFLYGRVVWEMMSSYWPQAESTSDDEHDLAFAPLWRETPKIVFSRTLKTAEWDARVIGDDLAEEVTALKRQPGGDLLITGGAGLGASLGALGLIDEYHIVVHPVVLGGGKRLFPEGTERLPIRLAEARTLDGRTVLLRFERTEQGEGAAGHDERVAQEA